MILPPTVPNLPFLNLQAMHPFIQLLHLNLTHPVMTMRTSHKMAPPVMAVRPRTLPVLKVLRRTRNSLNLPKVLHLKPTIQPLQMNPSSLYLELDCLMTV